MTRLLIIIPADILDAVREVASDALVFGAVAAGAFVPAGSPTGDEPATYWWLSGAFDEAGVSKLSALCAAFPASHVESYDLVTQGGRPWALLEEMGLRPLVHPADK